MHVSFCNCLFRLFHLNKYFKQYLAFFENANRSPAYILSTYVHTSILASIRIVKKNKKNLFRIFRLSSWLSTSIAPQHQLMLNDLFQCTNVFWQRSVNLFCSKTWNSIVLYFAIMKNNIIGFETLENVCVFLYFSYF